MHALHFSTRHSERVVLVKTTNGLSDPGLTSPCNCCTATKPRLQLYLNIFSQSILTLQVCFYFNTYWSDVLVFVDESEERNEFKLDDSKLSNDIADYSKVEYITWHFWSKDWLCTNDQAREVVEKEEIQHTAEKNQNFKTMDVTVKPNGTNINYLAIGGIVVASVLILVMLILYKLLFMRSTREATT